MDNGIFDAMTFSGGVPPHGSGADGGGAALRERLGRRRVTGAIAVSTQAVFYDAAAGNAEVRALCAAPGEPQLLPGMVLDPRAPGAERQIAGARMLCLLPGLQGWPVPFAPLTVLLKSFGAASGAERVPLWWEIREQGDATAAVALLESLNYPAPVIFGNVGGESLSEVFAAAKLWDKVHLATDSLHGIGEIGLAVRTLGAERVVFASGAPRKSLGSAVALLSFAGLKDEEAALMQGGNMRRLLAGGGAA